MRGQGRRSGGEKGGGAGSTTQHQHRQQHQTPPLPNSGEEWRALRLAWQPAFQSGSLERYSALMDACAAKLCDALAGAASEGRAVDVWRELGGMTMAVVGTTAFGIDFGSLGGARHEEGRRLVDASATVFSSSSIVSGSLYQPLLLMFPKAQRLVKWLAARLPDRRLVDITAARRVVRGTSLRLIEDWRAARRAGAGAGGGSGNGSVQEPAAAGSGGADDAAAAAPSAADATLEQLRGEEPTLLVEAAAAPPAGDGADAAPTGAARDQAPAAADAPAAKAAAAAAANGQQQQEQAKYGLGVAPGSFLGLLLGARDRAAAGGGHGDAARFNDGQIVAQATTFILAG